MEKMEIPTREDAEREAQVLTMKLILSPDTFTLLDLARLQELMIAEGYMDLAPSPTFLFVQQPLHARRQVRL